MLTGGECEACRGGDSDGLFVCVPCAYKTPLAWCMLMRGWGYTT